MTNRGVRTVGVVVTALALVACAGGGRSDSPWPRDPELGPRLQKVLGAEPTRVADLTDFDWSTLTVIDEGTERSEAKELLGIEFFSDDYYFGVGLAVFCGDGEVVMVTYLNTEALGGHFPRTVSRDALLGSGSLSDQGSLAEPMPHCVGA